MIFVNGTPIEFSKFPNGEIDLTKVPIGKSLTLKWESNEDLFNLMLVKRLLDNWVPEGVDLTILYMPYSRMDRDLKGGSCCSLRYVGEFIKSLNFKTIKVIDPHSDLTLAYLGENASGWFPFRNFLIPAFKYLQEPAVIMFPDAGAQKRYTKETMFKNLKQVVGYKKRDFATGHITDYDISDAECVRGKDVVIVDDLCSKGTTFLYAARALRRFEPRSVALLVSHCETTILNGELLDANSPIDYIITTDSIFDPKILAGTDVAHKFQFVKPV